MAETTTRASQAALLIKSIGKTQGYESHNQSEKGHAHTRSVYFKDMEAAALVDLHRHYGVFGGGGCYFL